MKTGIKQGINYMPTENPLLFVFSFAKKVLVFVRKKEIMPKMSISFQPKSLECTSH